jgi:hypothetical protein
MRMFKHCVNQFEEHILYDLLNTQARFNVACGLFGFMCSTILHFYYNGVYNTLNQWITPPYFGMFWIGKTPIWEYRITALIATIIGFLIGFWWGIVQNDVGYNGRKRWCIKERDSATIQYQCIDFEEKKND